jgi:hypothetical protein
MSNNLPNYGGKQPNNTAYVKNFVEGSPASLWTAIEYQTPSGIKIGAIAPSSSRLDNLIVPGDLYVNGSIINPSDIYLKENIKNIDSSLSNKLINLQPTEFTFKNDKHHKVHYGFIAQDFEKNFPELIANKPDKNVKNLKSINYLEIIPLLVSKIQEMQKEIDELKNR